MKTKNKLRDAMTEVLKSCEGFISLRSIHERPAVHAFAWSEVRLETRRMIDDHLVVERAVEGGRTLYCWHEHAAARAPVTKIVPVPSSPLLPHPNPFKAARTDALTRPLPAPCGEKVEQLPPEQPGDRAKLKGRPKNGAVQFGPQGNRRDQVEALLGEQPRTVPELSKALGIVGNSVLYHLAKLETGRRAHLNPISRRWHKGPAKVGDLVAEGTVKLDVNALLTLEPSPEARAAASPVEVVGPVGLDTKVGALRSLRGFLEPKIAEIFLLIEQDLRLLASLHPAPSPC